ncbi:MAG: DUF4173 domain-containing protein [Ruminococcus sp.]|nr:DUF4173 domain-containing protein [Ruminococcus sp.]
MEENRDNIQNTTDEQQCAPETIQPMPQPQMQAPPNMAYMGVPPQYGAVYTPYGVPAAAAKPKKKVEFTPLELGYSFAAFLMAFLLIRYAVCSPTGFVTTAVFIALFTGGLIFMKKSGAKADGRTKLTAGIGYLFSLVYSITANEFIKGLDSVFLCMVFIYLLDRLGAEDRRIPRFLPFVFAKAALERPLSNMELMPSAVSQSAKKTSFGKNVGLAVIGLIAAVIPTLVVGSLLMSADSGVEEMLGRIIVHVFSEDLVAMGIQLILAVPLGCYIFGLLFSAFHRDPQNEVTDDVCEVKLAAARKLHNMVIYAAVTPICLLYTLFFISQTNYLLSAFSGTLPEGFSYSEFARRGFFELLAIALINLGIILLINLIAKQGGKNKPAALRVYTLLIGFFTLVVIASALSKMAMYISVYGLTRLRVYTGWFMVLCAFIFLMIMIKQFRSGFAIWRYLTAVFVVMFGLLCFSRPDDIIARYNINMSRAGRLPEYGMDTSERDITQNYSKNGDDYLLTLSDDAVAVYLGYGCETADSSGKEPEKLTDRRNAYRRDPLSMFNISSLIVRSRLG